MHPASSERTYPIARPVGLACGLVAAGLSAIYLFANVPYTQSLALFQAGDMAGARYTAAKAVERCPVTDVYRVALADTVLYERDITTRLSETPATLSVLESGLSLEPRSYDLALARARTLARGGAGPAEVAESYVDAVERYPLGIEVRTAAANALEAAGRTKDASRMRAEVAALLSARGEER